ncbi:hypothetical protein HYPSUDRAFT_849766 [Hypholoma sublateritium FD-334 SS-4]|uniref:Uncharacterized protein n=1 Tax=Hypholoma sublateritium (strain FD-334 SS-4) TaxID=945553 RepID=A0A0D2KZR9_HYPSF|nr:hypothetical protein HYPSUDRAFT_849766 [Hypholoma sublateritium FD-334 SS-4]
MSESIHSPAVNYLQSWKPSTDNGRIGDRSPYFGEREESSPSSLRSNRLEIYAPSISEDGLSSLYECTAFDFPAPPPITSPVIRRMRSSPWFMDDSSDSLKNLSEQQRRIRTVLNESLTMESRDDRRAMDRLGSLSAASSFRTRDSFDHKATIHTKPRDNVEWTGRISVQGALPSSRSESLQCDQRRVLSALRTNDVGFPPLSQRPMPALQQSASMPHTNAAVKTDEEIQPREWQSARPIGRLPRIIRKVASMRSEAQKIEAPAVQSGPIGRKTIPKARSFRSILRSAEADRARERTNDAGEWHRPSSWVLGNPLQIVNPPAFSDVDSGLAGHREDNLSRHQHLSIPAQKATTTLRETDRHGSVNSGVLGAPFLHRPFQNSRKGNSTQEQCEGPDSFINITPDNKMKSDSKIGGKRDRMKVLIARASTSMFGWGKQRADRKPATK